MASNRLKCLERTFTMIILVGCIVSLYISSTSTPVSTRLGVMGRGYAFHADKGELRKSMFGQMFGSHRHGDLFRRHRAHSIQDSNQTGGSNESLATVEPDDTELWFRPYSVKPAPLTLKHHEHPHFRNFLISGKSVCKNSKIDILIYVHSATSNFQRRRILRETWANTNVFKSIVVKTVFMLGKTKDYLDQMKISNENLVYGDIVQGDFLDTQQNLTLKSIMVIRWIYEHCAQARYVIKSDDDIYVNIYAFVENFLSTLWSQPKTIVCHLRKNGSVPIVRDKTSKWYVSTDLLPNKTTFPQFCPGYALMFTGDLAPIMYAETFTTPVIPIDDVYTFGLLLEKHRDVTFVNVQSNFTLNQNLALEEYKGNGPITHVACNAWEMGAMEKFWFSTLQKLSPWALRHSSFGVLEKSRSLLNATFLP